MKENLIEKERRSCFDYFYQNFNKSEEWFGLMHDMVPTYHNDCSVAASGFLLAGIVIGVDYNYITKKEGQEVALKILKTHAKLERKKGFYYHFYNMWDGQRARKCELSIIDSGLFFAGALTAGGFFGGEVKALATQLYLDCDWEFFYDKDKKYFCMAEFENRGFSGHWDVYAEQLILYFLAAASPKGEKIAVEAYNSFQRLKGSYGGIEFIYSWFGSLFTHQFSHAFLDFRGVTDKEGVNWFENSKKATLVNRAYCIDHKKDFVGYSENGWGLTSCLTPTGYKGHIGVPPSGNNNIEHISVGVIPPCGAIGSIVFTPKESIESLEHFYSIPNLVGEYGLYDAYSEGLNWVSDSYISIDKGITLLMLANYEKQTVWKYFSTLPEIKKAFETLHFKKENN